MKCLLLLNILIIKFCAGSNSDRWYNWHLFVLQTTDENYVKLNPNFTKTFTRTLGYDGVSTRHVYDISVNDLNNKMIDMIHNKMFPVNLHASDFYEHNFADLSSDLIASYNGLNTLKTVCAVDYNSMNESIVDLNSMSEGDFNSTTKNTVDFNTTNESDVHLKSKSEGIIDHNSISKRMLNCNETTVILDGIKEFSANIEKRYPDLSNAIAHFEAKNPYAVIGRHKIVICLRNPIKSRANKETLERLYGDLITLDFQNDTNLNIDENTLAVLISGPIDIETTVPFVFYEPTYILLEHEFQFPNSATMFEWETLSIVMMEFLKLMKWRRIAVVSDDTEISEKFENSLITKFNDADKLYAIQQCSGRACNFREPLIKFRDAHAKIIIVNVDETNLEKFIKTAKALGMGRDKHWILRYPSNKAHKLPGNVYYIQVRPEEGTDQFDFHNEPIFYTILKGYSLIRDKYREVHGNHANFLKNIKTIENINNQIASVYSVNINKVIAEMKISNRSVRKFTSKLYHIKKYYSDWPSNCIVKVSSFYNSCGDMYCLYIVLVIVVFLLLLFVIIIVFNHFQKSAINYVNI